ncbi:MAG: glycosyltransferase family 9 protein, partial [Candidatus Hydrogenedentes bacterium]|nr:glycosyltransferase family 9 protein [Candidatus Hydrogenedentota bacterium]
MVQRSRHETRTLVVHTGGIGDFLLFCPCLKRLAEEGPVDLAGNDRDRLNLAVTCGIARNAHLLDDFDFGSVFGDASARFASSVSQYDRAVVWMNDGDGRIREAFLRAGVAHVQTHAGLPPAGWARHAGEYYASCLGYDDLPPLLLPFDTDDYVHDALIHPGSGGARKNWPIDRFVTLARALERTGRRVEWIRGPAEESLALPTNAHVVQVSSLVTLARHLTGAALYIGNDSGITHLAAACG